jgi:hypothetical protein
VAAALGALVACSSGFRQYPLKEPLWLDPDRHPFSEEPEEYYSPWGWDGANQMVFRPVSRFFAVDPAGESVNVNALDEVPDSSWFTNRIGRFPMTPQQVGQGPCQGPPLDPNSQWTVAGAKPNGANPGFMIKAEDGRRYMIKFDGVVQGSRATAADVIGSRVYHAAGYFVPCNEIVFFDRSILTIDPEAMGENSEGEKAPLTEEQLDRVFEKALRLPDGRYRASSSLFVEGKPIGPFTYDGTRGDDPNDVINHEDRRELRGSRVLAAWTHHYDSREQNSLDTWMPASGGGFVRHYLIDFGDCFGSLLAWTNLARRIGHASYMDIPEIGFDWVSLGLVERPWDKARFGPSGRVFGYYDVDRFDPDDYKPGYPNPAFLRASERDQAWMARIVARFSEDHLKAMVATAKFGDAGLDRELVRLLKGRQGKILRRYLGKLSPLSDPLIQKGPGLARLCLHDLAVSAGVALPSARAYAARSWVGESLAETPVAIGTDGADQVCVVLPPVPGASTGKPRYLIVDLLSGTRGARMQPPARVHLYHLGGAEYRVVGLQRPQCSRRPGEG